MSKFKYYLCIIIWTFMPKSCIAAVDLVLSDVIRDAREAQMKIAKTQIQQNVEQTKSQINKNNMPEGEQSAAEKLNTKEIMKQEK